MGLTPAAAAAWAPGGPEVLHERKMHERRIHVDKIAAVVAFVQIAMGSLESLSKSGCQTVLFGSLVIHAAHAWLLFGRPAKWYSQHRTLAATLVLAGVRALTAASIQTCNNPSAQDAGVTLTFRLLYKTGFVPLLWYYVALPLPLGLSVITHLLSAALYNRTLVVHACRRVFVLPGDRELLAGAWRAITTAVGVGAPLLGGIVLPKAPAPAPDGPPVCAAAGAGAGECEAEQGQGDVCMAAMTFVQFVLGVWAPLAASYMMMLRARRRMVEEHRREWEAERDAAAAQQRRVRQQQQRLYAGADGGGGGGGTGGSQLQEPGGGGAAAAAATAAGDATAVEKAPGVGGSGGGGGGGVGAAAAAAEPWGRDVWDDPCFLRVSPLALVLLTAAASNLAYWAIARALVV